MSYESRQENLSIVKTVFKEYKNLNMIIYTLYHKYVKPFKQ